MHRFVDKIISLDLFEKNGIVMKTILNIKGEIQ
jgi:hypothetical protein